MSNPKETEHQLLEALPLIEHKLNYTFRSKKILLAAFTHRSYLNEAAKDKEELIAHNERLEFLGDAIVNLFVSETLFRIFPHHDEGSLSKHKATLVSEKSLSQLIEQFDITKYLLMGRGERIQQSYKRASISADLFEAIVGAIYLDGGYDRVIQFVSPLFTPLLTTLPEQLEENPKAALQEFLAKIGKDLPEYILIKEDGPQHMKQFEYVVSIDGVMIGSGSGVTKKEAQKQAAKSALRYIEANGLPKKEA